MNACSNSTRHAFVIGKGGATRTRVQLSAAAKTFSCTASNRGWVRSGISMDQKLIRRNAVHSMIYERTFTIAHTN